MRQDHSQGLQMRSLIRRSGELNLSLITVPTATPAPDEVVVRIEATPINPSDIGLLFGAADLSTVVAGGTVDHPQITARVPDGGLRAMATRLDESLTVGNEGAGTVVAAGAGAAAQALLGRVCAMRGGSMYAHYRVVRAEDVLPLPDGASAADGAASFINPLTALCMVETMRREGHTALVHTAAASNLGQMLLRICQQDGIGLVNVVRSEAQAQLLIGLGAGHVVVSTAPGFLADLTAAIVETGATIAFDAVGGGELAGQILTAMETAVSGRMSEYSRYGSATFKQVYLYGSLSPEPTAFRRTFGYAWGIGGWLLTPVLAAFPPEVGHAMRQRVVSELKTTFASRFMSEISLRDALNPEVIAAYSRRATGEKYLINPTL